MIKIREKKVYKNFKVRKPLEIEAGETLTVATHSNVFHADEIVAIALLRIYYKGYNMKVIRSSCINDIKSSNFAINVGRQNKITDSQVKFDCTKEDNVYILGTGIKHCAATKVAQYLNVPESLFKKCLFGLAIDEKTEERVDSLEKDVIRMKAEMVTKERLDEIMDNKLKSLREDVAYLRKEVKEDIGDLRSDLNRHFQILVEQRNKK